MKLPPGLKYFILAIVVGLVAVVLIQSYIRRKLAVAPKPTRSVVVAEADIPAGTALESRLVKVATWPGDIVPPNALSSPQRVQGRVSSVPISKGEPILESKLAPEGTAAGLSGLLDLNNLAVTVKTNEVSGVAGFINPGDRVDLLVQLREGGGQGGEDPFSKIVLQNLKVLSKGQVWDQTGDKKPKVVPTVTLEVSPEQAEMLNLADNQGKIRLALRHQANKDFFATKGVDTSQLLNKSPAPQEVATIPSGQQKPTGPEAQMIKGMRVSQVQF